MADRLLHTQYDFIRKAIGHAAEPLSRSDDTNQSTPRGRPTRRHYRATRPNLLTSVADGPGSTLHSACSDRRDTEAVIEGTRVARRRNGPGPATYGFPPAASSFERE